MRQLFVAAASRRLPRTNCAIAPSLGTLPTSPHCTKMATAASTRRSHLSSSSMSSALAEWMVDCDLWSGKLEKESSAIADCMCKPAAGPEWKEGANLLDSRTRSVEKSLESVETAARGRVGGVVPSANEVQRLAAEALAAFGAVVSAVAAKCDAAGFPCQEAATTASPTPVGHAINDANANAASVASTKGKTSLSPEAPTVAGLATTDVASPADAVGAAAAVASKAPATPMEAVPSAVSSDDEDDAAPSLEDFGISSATLDLIAKTPVKLPGSDSGSGSVRASASSSARGVNRGAVSSSHGGAGAGVGAGSGADGAAGAGASPAGVLGFSSPLMPAVESTALMEPLVQEQLDACPGYLTQGMAADGVNEAIVAINDLFARMRDRKTVGRDGGVSQRDLAGAIGDDSTTRQLVLLLVHLGKLRPAGRRRYAIEC